MRRISGSAIKSGNGLDILRMMNNSIHIQLQFLNRVHLFFGPGFDALRAVYSPGHCSSENVFECHCSRIQLCGYNHAQLCVPLVMILFSGQSVTRQFKHTCPQDQSTKKVVIYNTIHARSSAFHDLARSLDTIHGSCK